MTTEFESAGSSVQPEIENTIQAPESTANGFAKLGLREELLAAVRDLGYTEPTPVQSKVIPVSTIAVPSSREMEGDESRQRYADLMVSSQTGSGKTAAFLLPVLHTLIEQKEAAFERERQAQEKAAADALANGENPPRKPKRRNPKDPRNFKAATPGALVLCPTRELAQQVAHDAIDLVRHCRGLRVASVVGGMPYHVQVARLQNADLVVATPGRLLDLQRSSQIKLSEVQFLVVDEADRMLDLGFSDDLAEINNLTSQRRQTLMFSATFAPRIQQLAMRVMHEGGQHVQKVQIDSPQERHANITQSLYWADNFAHKRRLLDHWLRDASIDQAIVFASTQIECDGLAEDLQQAGFAAVALHGALSQGLRNRRLMALRNGQVQILVATDVAARGIDVPTITHVFNFGLPMKAEDYTHRIGRTGRAGRSGLAITFAEFRDRRRIGDIEAYTRQRFEEKTVAGMEPTQPVYRSAPRGNGRPQGRGGRNGGGDFRGNRPRRADGDQRGGFGGQRAQGGFRDDDRRGQGHGRGEGRGFGGGHSQHHAGGRGEGRFDRERQFDAPRGQQRDQRGRSGDRQDFRDRNDFRGGNEYRGGGNGNGGQRFGGDFGRNNGGANARRSGGGEQGRRNGGGFGGGNNRPARSR
ncbi:DEAD/DEAH box helicase [Hydrogenophaga sp. 5NK40-0174]|uniref:DEAD/DEAH box helicase n=1 Tax=Hydrogenophaga sp. 5NK40-0174 TaxID=3127649 RepID=UPI00310A716C